MDIFKNKLFITVLLAIAVAAGSYWYQSPNLLSKDKLESWIIVGHSQQFCNVIYPRIQHCLKFEQPACLAIAKEQITNCFNLNKVKMPKYISGSEAKNWYQTNTSCFQNKMQTELIDNYLIKTPECRQRLS